MSSARARAVPPRPRRHAWLPVRRPRRRQGRSHRLPLSRLSQLLLVAQPNISGKAIANLMGKYARSDAYADDVNKRLGMLFEKLRAGGVSAAVFEKLQQLCQALSTGDARTARTGSCGARRMSKSP